jgi:predicted nucleic acid-binding protein
LTIAGSRLNETRRWPEPAYLDASALTKLFVREAESDDLRRAEIGQHVVVSDLAITEVTSAMHRLGCEGVLTHAEVVGVLAAVHRGVEAAESFAIN